jgi:hypothetical protein
MSSLLDQALLQVEHVKSFCNFTIVLNIEDQERRPPAHLVDVRSGPTLRPDPLLRRTFDPEIWHGLGVVGLWAAIDAFRERKGKKAGQMAPGSLACSPRFAAARRLGRGGWFTTPLCAQLRRSSRWLLLVLRWPAKTQPRPHHRFTQPGLAVPLTSGTGSQFDGHSVKLTIVDLRYYVEQAVAILRALDPVW